MVHRAERHLWPARSEDRRDRGVRCAARHRALWHRHHAGGANVLRLACRELSRPDQARNRCCNGLGTARAAPGCASWSDSRGGFEITGWNSGDLLSTTTAELKIGRAGTCRAMRRSPMPSMSTRPMRSGSATGARTQSCASIPKPRNSSLFRYRIPTPMCGSSQAGRAKSGVPNPAPTSCSW